MVDATSQLFKPILPDSLVERVVKCLHEPPHFGHLGARKTKASEPGSTRVGMSTCQR